MDSYSLLVTRKRAEEAFTAVELLIVLVVLAILSILVVQGSIHARHRQQASLTLDEARQLDAAKSGLRAGQPEVIHRHGGPGPNIIPVPQPVSFAELTPYLKADSPLRARGGKDPLGHEFILGLPGVSPRVHPATQSALSAVTGGEAYWGPYL